MEKSQARSLNEWCICGSAGYCDASTRRMVECRNIRADKCQLFETSQVC